MSTPVEEHLKIELQKCEMNLLRARESEKRFLGIVIRQRSENRKLKETIDNIHNATNPPNKQIEASNKRHVELHSRQANNATKPTS